MFFLFRLTPKLVLGLGVMIAGLLITADQLGLFDAQPVYDYWPVLIIAVGSTKIASRQTSDKIFALIWVSIGAWLLAWNLDYVDHSPVEMFWPLVLIIFGLSLIFGALRQKRSVPDKDSNAIIVAVMSSVDRQNSSQDFAGGDVTIFMGGGELDLRQAEISGGDAVVQIFAMWGGYTFRVPPDWDVKLDVLPLLGGVTDLRSHHERRENAPRLTLEGVVIMGGVELKN